jgi:hypothetical protein
MTIPSYLAFILLRVLNSGKKFLRLQIKSGAAFWETVMPRRAGSPKSKKFNGNTRAKKTSKVS